MLQRDYILALLEDFVSTVVPCLRKAFLHDDLSSVHEVEQELAGLLDLDASCALALTPDSLVTMTRLSGIGDSLAGYAAYVLTALADVYDQTSNSELAELRRAQGRAMAQAFGWDLSEVPEGFDEISNIQESLTK